MQVREILSAKGGRVVTIRPDATVATAVHRLALERVGALVVSEDGSAIAGAMNGASDEAIVVSTAVLPTRLPIAPITIESAIHSQQRRLLRPSRAAPAVLSAMSAAAMASNPMAIGAPRGGAGSSAAAAASQ